MNLVDPDVDRYLAKLAAHGDPVLEEMERVAASRDFPIVGPQVGRLLEALARAARAERVLELGSGFGYSAYWFLRGLPASGRLVMTEGSSENAASARAYLERGGFSGRFESHVGDGLAVARTLSGPFDIVFCDVDKQDYPQALPIARALLRDGGLLIVDNMLWQGKVLGAPPPGDRVTAGVVELTRLLAEATDFATTLVPLRDGVTVSVRRSP